MHIIQMRKVYNFEIGRYRKAFCWNRGKCKYSKNNEDLLDTHLISSHILSFQKTPSSFYALFFAFSYRITPPSRTQLATDQDRIKGFPKLRFVIVIIFTMYTRHLICNVGRQVGALIMFSCAIIIYLKVMFQLMTIDPKVSNETSLPMLQGE